MHCDVRSVRCLSAHSSDLPHGSPAGELEKLRNRTEGLVSKADYQKDLKKLKSALTKEMDEKIEEVGACLPSALPLARLLTSIECPNRLDAHGYSPWAMWFLSVWAGE